MRRRPEPDPESDPEAGPNRNRRRRLVWAGGVALAVLVLAWVTVNVYPYASPAPRWTEADLAPLPPASDNGWSIVTGEPTDERLDLDVPRSLSAWLEPEGRAGAALDLEPLEAFLATPAARQALVRVEQVRRKPAFADSCAILAGSCRMIDWHRDHEVACLRAIELALVGDPAEASVLLADLIRLDLAQLGSPRSLLSLLVGLSNLQRALITADRITGQALVGPGPSATPLADAVASVDVDPLDLRPVVIAEYLVHVEALEQLVDDNGPRWLYSPGLTLAAVDARFERRYEAALDHDVRAALGGGEAPAERGPLWWVRNPVGILVLDALQFDARDVAEDVAEHLVIIEASRAKVLRQLSVDATP